MGCAVVGAAAMGVDTDSEDATERPKKNPPPATAAANKRASATRLNRRRGFAACGGVGAVGRPTVGGSVGQSGLSDMPDPGAGAVMKLRSANEGPGRAASGTVAAGCGGATCACGDNGTCGVG